MTPAQLGYRWPAEWETHAATWVAWPHNLDTWPGHLDSVRAQMALLVCLLADHEPVHVLAGGEQVMSDARRMLSDHRSVTLHDVLTDDAWCRDHGPTFLQAPPGAPAGLVDWDYNAWGGKYPPFDRDDAVPARLAEMLGYRCFAPGIVLEGGSIEGNGNGLLLTTERCLLNPNRNPGLSRDQIEQCLRDYLAVDKILWLSGGELAGDDTDGHVDQVARFVDASTIVAAVEEDPQDENYGPLQQNYVLLQQMSDPQGRPLQIVPLPMPRAKYIDDIRLPASYCNFYLANGVCLVPQFGDPADDDAIRILASLLLDHQVVGLPALELALGFGSFHCLTQQQPLPFCSQPGESF